MNEDAYVARNLRDSIKYRDIHKVPQFKNKDVIFSMSKESARLINSSLIWRDSIDKINVKGKAAWTVKNPKAFLAQKLLINNLKKNYFARSNDRKFIIDLIVSHLKDSYSYCVHRFDIKSFYESFDRKDIINKVKNDSVLSRKTIKILESLFDELNSLGVYGLPRGMGISSALSELMMAEFDERVNSLEGVLFYARFVDDILIISAPSLSKNSLKQSIDIFGLPNQLVFHNTGDKNFFSPVSKTVNASKETIKFDFLGYEFHIKKVDNEHGDALTFKRRDVNVLIAPSKVKKIKNRILKSFFAVLSSQRATEQDVSLLNKRIMFLSKNYLLPNSPQESKIYSGIYHNYSFVDNIDQLKEIDLFYRSLLFGNSTRLNKRIRRSLCFNTRKGLGNHSFLRGFEEREFCRLTNADYKEIKKAWG